MRPVLITLTQTLPTETASLTPVTLPEKSSEPMENVILVLTTLMLILLKETVLQIHAQPRPKYY